MAHPIKELEQELMNLPNQERARLAHELIASLDSGEVDEMDRYWEQELPRRLANIDETGVNPIPAQESFARARNELNK